MPHFLIRVWAIASKEVRHVRRDVRTLYLALGVPVMLLVLFGYGVSFDIDEVPVLVVDHDRTRCSRELIRRFFASGEVLEVGRVEDGREAIREMEFGHGSATLIVPAGFGDDLEAGRRTELQLLVDGSDNASATQVLAKADALISTLTMQMALGPRESTPPIVARVITWFNPAGRSALFLVPGLTAYVLAIVAVLLTSLTVAREWERGSMQQLFATPVSCLEIVVGKLIPYLGLGIVAAMLTIASGAWIFDVPMRGDPAALGLATLLFLMGMLGQGLFISVLTGNQMVATQVATLSSMLPSLLLSGFVFPVENMPTPFRMLANIIPAQYYVHALRGVMLRGNGFVELWPDLAALGLFASAILTIAIARFRREVA